MTSNRPFTFDDVVDNSTWEVSGIQSWWPRPNTAVYLHGETPLDLHAEVFVYGGRIATMYADGDVRLEASSDMSNTVRNRLNDVLTPLGWRLRKLNGRWLLSRVVPGAPDVDNRYWLEYVTGMIVHPITTNKKEA